MHLSTEKETGQVNPHNPPPTDTREKRHLVKQHPGSGAVTECILEGTTGSYKSENGWIL